MLKFGGNGKKFSKILTNKESIEALIAFLIINVILINFFVCLCYVGVYKAYIKLVFLGLIWVWLIINAFLKKLTYKTFYTYWLIFLLFFILIEGLNIH